MYVYLQWKHIHAHTYTSFLHGSSLQLQICFMWPFWIVLIFAVCNKMIHGEAEREVTSDELADPAFASQHTRPMLFKCDVSVSMASNYVDVVCVSVFRVSVSAAQVHVCLVCRVFCVFEFACFARWVLNGSSLRIRSSVVMRDS